MSRDPTRSESLRKHGRATVAKRVHLLHQELRQHLDGNDVAGLRLVPSRTPFINWEESASMKLERTTAMVQHALNHSLTTRWAEELVERSVQRGIAQVEQELRTTFEHLDADEVSGLYSAAASSEVRGIAGETERRLLRHVVRALETKARPETLMKDVRATLEKVTKLRLNVLVATNVVRGVNAGKLAAYGAAGFEMVGIDPEHVPSSHVHVHDAKKKRKRGEIAFEWDPAKEFAQLLRTYGSGGTDVVVEGAEMLFKAMNAIPAKEELVHVLTAGDDKVCESCEDIASDGPYEISEAMDLIPAHPNCRCAFVPFGDRRFAAREEDDDWDEDE